MERPTVADVAYFVFDVISRYNALLRFYQYLESRPAPIEPFLHQVEILTRCMLRDKVRILVGDEIGLGKTITAIVVGKYLEDIGLAKKILILLPRILVGKWETEIRYWVGKNVYVVESSNIDNFMDVGFSEGWYIVSMDLFARNSKVRETLLTVNWDLVIVDEAHRLSPSAKLRWKYIGEELIGKKPQMHIVLLTATPHKGFPHDYIAKLRILDPMLTSNVKNLDKAEFYKQTWNVLVFRRMKGDINNIYERNEIFKPAHLTAVLIRPSDAEAEFYRNIETILLDILRKSRHEKRTWGLAKLLAVLLAKRAFSSPVAAYSTLSYIITKRTLLLSSSHKDNIKREAEKMASELRKRIVRHLAGDYGEEGEEPSLEDTTNVINEFLSHVSLLLDENTIRELGRLAKLAKNIQEGGDTKLSKLVELVKYHLSEGSKVVVFTEYTDTAHYVFARLKEAIGGRVTVLTGEEAQDMNKMKDIEVGFLRGDRFRVLVSTDVLSEGLDLQVANVLINYDLPWTPLKLEQRIGRVWRLGQGKECHIYLFVVGSSDRTTGASRVVSVLYTKLLNMERALGPGKMNPILGENVEVYDKNLSEGERERDILITGRKLRKGKGTFGESEIILRSLNDKKFAEFAEQYVKAVRKMVERVRNNDADPQPAKGIIKSLAFTTGFSSREELREVLLNLTRSLAEAKGVLKSLGEGKEVVEEAFYQKPLQDMSVRELVDVVSKFECRLTAPVRIVVAGDVEQKVYVFKVKLLLDGVERFVDILGVSESPLRVMGASELLKLLLLKFKEFHVTAHINESELDNAKTWASSVIREYLRRTIAFQDLEGVKRYAEILIQRKLRKPDRMGQSRIDIVVESLGVIEVRKLGDIVRHAYNQYLGWLVGVYDRRRAEVERKAIEVLKSRLNSEFSILDVHELGWYFDLIMMKKGVKSEEQRLVEVKSWELLDPSVAPLVILTDNEKWFGENCEKLGFNYWLYTVDMRDRHPIIKGYRNPLTSALELKQEIKKGNRTYYIYNVVREGDEVYYSL